MFFPFTFNFNVPGIINPFASTFTSTSRPEQDTRTNQSPTNRQRHSQTHSSKPVPAPTATPTFLPAPAPPYTTSYPISYPVPIPSSSGAPRTARAKLPKINRPRPSPSPSPAPLSRKRGWEPEPSPSWSTTSLTLATTSGYLDTPAKYRHMSTSSQSYGPEGNNEIMTDREHEHGYDSDQDEDQEYSDDMPPLKKRRGLAGSIVSTAVNAALIGTAVGLTVYRLWRDRGREPQIRAAPHEDSPDPTTQLPPPPYQEKNEWQHLEQPAAIRVAPPTPSTPRSAARHHSTKRRQVVSTPKRPVVYHATRRTRPAAVSAAPIPVRPEFDFGRDQEEQFGGQDEVEDKMDWIGDKLSMLIEQGKRALGSEVVVMSDAKEDEVDDGSGAWEEADSDDDHSIRQHQGRSKARDVTGSGPSSRANSIRASSSKRVARPKNIVPPPSGVGLGLYNVNASSSTSLSTSPRQTGYMHGHAYIPSPPSTSTSYASASAGFSPGSAPSFSIDTPRRMHVRGISYETALPSPAPVVQEDPSAWQSAEMRESMERARARLMARRAGSGV